MRHTSVYIVDDEPLIASTLSLILNKSGYRTTSFTNPLLALESARTEAPDILLSDVSMPGLSGIDLARQVKALWPLCRILLFSGHALPGLHGPHYSQPEDLPTILTKPLHPQLLLVALRNLCTRPLLGHPLLPFAQVNSTC